MKDTSGTKKKIQNKKKSMKKTRPSPTKKDDGPPHVPGLSPEAQAVIFMSHYMPLN